MPFPPTASGLRLEALEDRLTPVSVLFDYRFDTRNFFADPARRALLEQAAAQLTAGMQDHLAPIVPVGGNTWQVYTSHPSSGQTLELSNLVIPGDTVLVFVGARPLGDAAAVTVQIDPAATAAGSPQWKSLVQTRGQPEVLSGNDYAPWGASIAFDSTQNWYFGASPTGLQPEQYDFYSAALHELGHVFGFSDGNPSFARWLRFGLFQGPAVMQEARSPVPVDAAYDSSHWADQVVIAGRAPLMGSVAVPGERTELTWLDRAALRDIGWSVGSLTPPVVSPPPVQDPTFVPAALSEGGEAFAVGPDSGVDAPVQLYDPDRSVRATVTPFPESSGGVRVATADFNSDGVPDLVVGTGPGSFARVRVLDGVTQAELFALTPFGDFTGGVFVVAGDLTGDGRPDLVITPDQGGGPRVRVFSGVGFTQVADFFGIEDRDFRGGARAAVGDLNGDQAADLLVAAGFGGGPRVAGYDGKALSSGPLKLFPDFFAFEPELRDGVYLASGDVDADGFAEVITGAGPGGGPRVSVFDGRVLAREGQAIRRGDFFAGDPTNRGGVRVAAKDLDADGRDDLITGAGGNSGSRVTAYTGRNLGLVTPPEAFGFEAYAGFRGGVFVG